MKTETILLVILLIYAGIQGLWLQDKFNKIAPTIQEQIISAQTVLLRGEIYICGSVQNNKDKESLYCRGFNDGYSWAVRQIDLDIQLRGK